MRHTNNDMRIEFVRSVERINDLPLTDQEVAVVGDATFGKPCGIEANNRYDDIVEVQRRNVGKAVWRDCSGLTAETGVLEGTIGFLPL